MRYFELIRRYPELFVNPSSSCIVIEQDPEKIQQIEQKMMQRLTQQGLPAEWACVGVIHEDQYVLLLRDAVYFGDGTPGTYIRFVREESLPGVIILPIYQDQVLLTHHFRHATRAWHLEIPRGFGLPTMTAAENARRELYEEIGATPTSLLSLGRVHTDTGISGECNEFFLAYIDTYGQTDVYEGISKAEPVSLPEFERLIREDIITDSYTITAYARARLRSLL